MFELHTYSWYRSQAWQHDILTESQTTNSMIGGVRDSKYYLI